MTSVEGNQIQEFSLDFQSRENFRKTATRDTVTKVQFFTHSTIFSNHWNS